MSNLFDNISRLVASPISGWQMFWKIFGLIMAATLISGGSGHAGKRSAKDGPKRLTDSERRIVERNPLYLSYSDLAQQERYASMQVVALDQQLRLIEDNESSTQKRLELLEGERELFLADLPINEKLQSLYKAVTQSEDLRDNDPLLIRTALLHWTVLLRRRSMQGFHTVVEGLEDADCSGDIIADQLLVRYFDTLFEEERGIAREALAVRALAELARQSACIGAQQSAVLASDLYWSFIELRGFLRLNGLEHLVPYVAQAAAAPMLLFYDVEKYRGPQSPLARWFEENYEWLIQGAETKRIPIVWHGLWLYDRRTGRLIGYRPKPKPADENDVHLAMFLASIVNRENLGRYDCSFAEMIERGTTIHGYLCAGSICSDAKQSGTSGGIAMRGKLAGTMQGSVTGKLSTAGFSEESIKETLCNQSSSRPGGGGRDGSTLCGDGVSGLGRSWAANAVRCLSEQVMQPGEKLMRCTAEAIGLCSSPIETAVKNLQQTSFAGIRLGKNCQWAEGAETGSKSNADQQFQEAELKAYRELLDADRNAAANAKSKIDAAIDKFKTEVNTLETFYQLALDSINDTLPEADRAAARAELEARYKASYDSYEQTRDANIKAAREQEQKKREEAREDYKKKVADAAERARKTKEAEQKAKVAEEKAKGGSGTTQGLCPPDTLDCGGNDCTGMGAAAMQTMRCFEQEAREEELKEIANQPGYVDPNPIEDSPGLGLGKCFESFGDEVSTIHKECWAYDCGPQDRTGMTVGGNCSCGGETTGDPSEHLTGMCATIQCTEGSPRVQNGICTCGGPDVETAGTFGSVTIPKGTFITSLPRFFSEVHLRNMPQNEGMPPQGGSPRFP